MAIDAIGRSAVSEPQLDNTGVELQDFLEIFLTQLNFQDPLEPVDNAEFVAQLAQFSSLQLASQTTDNTEGLLDVESVSQILALMGKKVRGTDFSGESVVGTVTGLQMNGGQPLLTVKTGENEPERQVNPSTISVISN